MKIDKIPVKEIKKLNPSLLEKLINYAKQEIKKSDVMMRVCQEYGVDVDVIDLIPTVFEDLDVSAKTDHGIVYLNYKLLEDGEFDKDFGYLIHEYTHFFQQCFNTEPTQGADEGEYLENPFEQEGFQNQIEYMSDEFGTEEAEKYVDHLLDYHEIEDKKKDDLKEVLLENV